MAVHPQERNALPILTRGFVRYHSPLKADLLLTDQEPSASKSKLDCFKETARQLGCDEDEAAFDEKLGKITRQKPKDEFAKPGK